MFGKSAEAAAAKRPNRWGGGGEEARLQKAELEETQSQVEKETKVQKLRLLEEQQRGGGERGPET